jgi:hypothetical protein
MATRDRGRVERAKRSATQTAENSPAKTRQGRRVQPNGARPDDPDWKSFVDDNKSEHPDLVDSIVYALPILLITAIQHRIPRFFSSDEGVFERDLAQYGGTGFLKGHPFSHPFLGPIDPDPRERERIRSLEDSIQKSVSAVEQMLADDMRERGLSDEEIERYRQQRLKYQAAVKERQRSYLGWLVTNPDFVTGRDRFFQTWRSELRKDPFALRLPISFFGEPPRIPKRNRQFYQARRQFFCRWGIAGFVTPHLPILIEPQWELPSLHYLPDIAEAGMLLFIPLYLLRDRDLNIYRLLEHELLRKDLRNLETWLNEPRKLGHVRFKRMFQLFVYFELALKRRYSDRIRQNRSKLDEAFADFFRKESGGTPISEDSVRKVRNAMSQRLRGEHSHRDSAADCSRAPSGST